MPKAPLPLTDDERSRAAASLVVFLGGRPEEMQRLMGTTGLTAEDFRAGLGDAGFETGLIDYLVHNEPLLLAFCEEAGFDPAQLMRLVAGDRGDF